MPQLLRLQIEHFELIEAAEIRFAPGLTVLTGETGSGKTMVLDALAFAVGERAAVDRIRRGAERARVTLVAALDAKVGTAFASQGIELDPAEDEVLVVRELFATGRTSARVNGVPVSVTQLRAIGSSLFELIGQHEHQRLLAADFQRETLDRFAAGGDEAVDEVRTLWAAFTALEDGLTSFRRDSDVALRRRDEAAASREEIARIAPVAGEDERLRERAAWLANSERIALALRTAHEALAGEGGAVDALASAAGTLGALGAVAPALAARSETVRGLQSEADEVAVELARALESIDVDPRELDAMNARLDELDRLKRRHGGTLTAVLEFASALDATIDAYAARDADGRRLELERDSVRANLETASETLSDRRRRAKAELEVTMALELRALGMPAARFEVALSALQTLGPAGAETVEFRLSSNPGEPVRAIAKAASGGELSRVLLALVVSLAGRREPSALVFDEIDAGIGGATADAVGVRIGRLGRATQVVSVTHLAQIASFADAVIALRKRDDGATTRIDAVELTDRSAIEAELARMLSGKPSAVALAHAERLLADARKRKTH